MSIPAPVPVHALVCHRDTNLAIKTLGSLLRFSAQPIQLIVHDDGSLTEGDREKLLNHLNITKLISRPEADVRMAELLKGHPHCFQYRRDYIYGLKLLDIALLSDTDFGYCDSDILFMRPFTGMFQFPNEKVSAIFMRDYLSAYSMLPWTLIGTNKPRLVSKVNAGLIFFRKAAYDLDFINWFLGHKEFRHKTNWLEQTCWSALGHRVGCQQWNPEQIVLVRPWTKPSKQIVAGHFVGEVRHRVEEFLPHMSPDDDLGAPIWVGTFSPPDCNLIELGKTHAMRQTKRLKNYSKIPAFLQRKLFDSFSKPV